MQTVELTIINFECHRYLQITRAVSLVSESMFSKACASWCQLAAASGGVATAAAIATASYNTADYHHRQHHRQHRHLDHRQLHKGVVRAPTQLPITKQLIYPPYGQVPSSPSSFPAAAVPSKNFPRGLPDAKECLVSL